MSDLPLPPLPATFGVLAMQPDFVRAVEAYARTAVAAAVQTIDRDSRRNCVAPYVCPNKLLYKRGREMVESGEISATIDPPVAEPVAQTELIEETANDFPLALRERVRDAMRNAWVGGYNERVDEAHPPALSEEFIREAMRLMEEYAGCRAWQGSGLIDATSDIDAARAALEAHLRSKG